MKTRSAHALALVVGSAALAAVTAPAGATTFSFASDDDSSAFTLTGTAGAAGVFSIRNGRDPAFTPVTLRIDDDNMALPTASLPVGLRVDLTASYIGSQPVGGGQSHIYGVSGQYALVNPNNSVEMLRVNVMPGAATMTVGGTATSWGSAGSIFGSDAASGTPFGVDWFISSEFFTYAASQGIDPFLYGLAAFGFAQEDFAFTMTNLNNGAGVAIDPTSRLPLAVWGAEASHSSHAIPVPAPGAGVTLALIGLAAARRRRIAG